MVAWNVSFLITVCMVSFHFNELELPELGIMPVLLLNCQLSDSWQRRVPIG